MRSLPKPLDKAKTTYLTCISRVRDEELKGRLKSIADTVEATANQFEIHAAAATLHVVPPTNDVDGVVNVKEMVDVYDFRMARRGGPGRPIYDRLLSSAPSELCPLCAQRTVSTLDHHLPKTRFPALTVAPLNLVPVCKDCNSAKGNIIPADASAQTFHPYFDNVQNDLWLCAEVLVGSPASLRFFVDPPGAWGAILSQRIANHFEIFELAKLYASHSAVELRNIQYALHKLNSVGGGDAIRAHLKQQAESREAAHLNSWQAATYRALWQDNWFISGGFAA